MNARRRLKELEARARRAGASTSRGEARARIMERLGRVAELRRGGATVEDDAELADLTAELDAALQRWREKNRGEGGR